MSWPRTGPPAPDPPDTPPDPGGVVDPAAGTAGVNVQPGLAALAVQALAAKASAKIRVVARALCRTTMRLLRGVRWDAGRADGKLVLQHY